MSYRIISTRIGVPGTEYIPAEGVNVAALIAGGFIEDTHMTPPKSDKHKGKVPDTAKITRSK